MQLKQHRSLSAALAAATYSLLGISPNAAANTNDQTQVDSAALYYNEKNRVTVGETATIITIPLSDEESLLVSSTIDVITGASPTGAVPTNTSQTIGSTTTPANQLPLQQFTDQRYALSLQWQYPVDRLSRAVVGGEFSTEKDYDSLGANYSHMWDTENKLTTFTLGFSGSLDSVKPSTGIVPKGLSVLNSASTVASNAALAQTTTAASGSTSNSSGSTTFRSGSSSTLPIRSKQIVDGLVGVTRVINRRTLMQFNYGIGMSGGYMTDPYKIISLVDPISGATTSFLSELRPSNRLRQTLYWGTVFHLPKDVIHLSYRHYWDDWQIKSDTVELNYHFKFGASRFYFEPQLRYYTQTAADFYHYSLVSGDALPQYASADYRLGEMTSYSYAVKVAMPISNEGEISLHAMKMQQIGNSHPNDAIGEERNQNLYPGLDASSIQLNLSFKF